MIVSRGEICVSQPGGGSSGVNMIAGAALIESNDKKRVRPVRARRHQRHERLKKGVALRGRAVVHVVGHVRGHEGKVDGRIEIRERLNVRALAWIQSNAFKTNRRIVFSDVLPGDARTINAARACCDIGAVSGIVLNVNAP
jgi:hypothetical protein